MVDHDFDEARLHSDYDFTNPLDCARYQRTVYDFMATLKSENLSLPKHKTLLDDFCIFVHNREVWHLADMVVPEFREAKAVFDERRDTMPDGVFTLLDYVLSSLKDMLPPPRRRVLTLEQVMLSQRNTQLAVFVVTGGSGMEAATQAQKTESDDRESRLEEAARLNQGLQLNTQPATNADTATPAPAPAPASALTGREGTE